MVGADVGGHLTSHEISPTEVFKCTCEDAQGHVDRLDGSEFAWDEPFFYNLFNVP